MTHSDSWDWEIGSKLVADLEQWQDEYSYMEEPFFSPDGQTVAAVTRNEDMEFSVMTQNADSDPQPWENTFEKVWNLRYGNDGRLSALTSDMAEWTVATDGETWENTWDFVWNMTFSPDGQSIGISAQKDLTYCVAVNDSPWETDYPRLTAMIMSPCGTKTAAVVESVPALQGEIFTFRKGCYTVAVDGNAWGRNFMNVWEPAFSKDLNQVSASVRSTYYEYSVAVNGERWDSGFGGVWGPAFSPVDDSVTAPVKYQGKWYLAKDDALFWKKPYFQLWHHQYSPDGSSIAAIAATDFGIWTITVNDVPWSSTFNEYVTDLVFSPDSQRTGCVFKDNGKWGVAVDDKPWDIRGDMAWQPVFSPDGDAAAAKIEIDGELRIMVNGKLLDAAYSSVEPPVFNHDGSRLMIRGTRKKQCFRDVVSVD